MANGKQVPRRLIVGILLLSAALYFGVTNDGILSDPKAEEGYHAEPIEPDTAIAEQAPHYENLTAAEKETVGEILNASDGDPGSHVPRVNDAFVEELPTTIWKEDTLYRIEVAIHID